MVTIRRQMVRIVKNFGMYVYTFMNMHVWSMANYSCLDYRIRLFLPMAFFRWQIDLISDISSERFVIATHCSSHFIKCVIDKIMFDSNISWRKNSMREFYTCMYIYLLNIASRENYIFNNFNLCSSGLYYQVFSFINRRIISFRSMYIFKYALDFYRGSD